MKWLFRRKLNWFDCICILIVSALMVNVSVLFGLLYFVTNIISVHYEKKFKIHY